jgi:LysM repeat protein
MPGLFDVLATLAAQVTTACYPNGTSSPSVTGKQITIQQGFPIRVQQDIDLTAGHSHVYVYPTTKERVVTKFQRDFQPLTLTASTLTATVSGITVTIGGSVSTPQAVMVINNGTGYGYQVQSGDTLNSIATNVAALIPGASAVGPVITIPGSHSLIARIATNYSASEELARVERVFDIFIVSPNPTDRATILNAIDVYLKINFRIVGSDNFYLLLFYQDQPVIDMLEQEYVYKGILQYMVQYPTTVTNNYTTITDPFINSLTVNWQ